MPLIIIPEISTIREFIQSSILNNSSDPIGDDQDLLLSGLLDSLSVVRLVTWLEKQCGIKIPPEDILVEHFGSLDQIVAYMQTRST